MENVVDVEFDTGDDMRHRFAKLMIGAVAAFVSGLLVDKAYDKFVLNRNAGEIVGEIQP